MNGKNFCSSPFIASCLFPRVAEPVLFGSLERFKALPGGASFYHHTVNFTIIDFIVLALTVLALTIYCKRVVLNKISHLSVVLWISICKTRN